MKKYLVFFCALLVIGTTLVLSSPTKAQSREDVVSRLLEYLNEPKFGDTTRVNQSPQNAPTGFAGAWQQMSGVPNTLTPTNTSAGIFVRASSTIDSSLRVNGNASTTGYLVVGTTQPVAPNMRPGDLLIGNGATTTDTLTVGANSLGQLSVTQGAATRRGIGVRAASAATANLLVFQDSSANFLSGFTAAGGLLMNISSTTALNIQNGSGVSSFSVDSNNGSATTTGHLSLRGSEDATANSGGNGNAFVDIEYSGTQNGLFLTRTAAAATNRHTVYLNNGVSSGGANALLYMIDSNTNSNWGTFYLQSQRGGGAAVNFVSNGNSNGVVLDSAATSGDGIQIQSELMTSGDGLEIWSDSDIQTGRSIKVLGGSSFNTEVFAVDSRGNATSTGFLVVGTTQPTLPELGVGDGFFGGKLRVGSNATTSGYLVVGTTNPQNNMSAGDVLMNNATTSGDFVVSGGDLNKDATAIRVGGNLTLGNSIAAATDISLTFGNGGASNFNLIGSNGPLTFLQYTTDGTVNLASFSGRNINLTPGGTGKVVVTSFQSTRSTTTDSMYATGLLQDADGGTNDLCIDANNQIVEDTSGTCVASTARSKHDINPLSMDSFSIINALQPASFIRNIDDTNTLRWGFIAEEAAKANPHLATYGSDGLPRGLDDHGFLAVIWDAIKEMIGIDKKQDQEIFDNKLKVTTEKIRNEIQEERIEELERQIEELKGEIRRMRESGGYCLAGE